MKTKIENKVTSRSVYDMITDRITEQLAKGIVPWHQPWAGGSALAISYRSRKPYSMLNQLLLGKPGEWLTWNEVQALGEQDWQVTLLDSYGKQIEYRVVYAASGLEAASEAVDDWLEANGLDTSFAVSL